MRVTLLVVTASVLAVAGSAMAQSDDWTEFSSRQEDYIAAHTKKWLRLPRR